MQALNTNTLEVGMVLPWTIYSKEGELLLSEGSSINNERVLNLLIGRGAFCLNDKIAHDAKQKKLREKEEKSVKLSAFNHIDAFQNRLHNLLFEIVKSPKPEQKHEINECAGELQTLIWKYPDMILGKLLLDKESPYSKLHPIMASLVSANIAKKHGLSPEIVQVITCANMTANLGMLLIQDELAEHQGPLSAEQDTAIKNHPLVSQEILQSIGVNDPIWLEIVVKHHEKIDGSGYPNGLATDDIPDYVRVSTLADVYSAMVLPRKYRDGIHCHDAIKKLFGQRDNSLDKTLIQRFIKDMGIYPPGCWVKLKSGQMAIVIKRGIKSATQPTISVLTDSTGSLVKTPLINNLATTKSYNIKEVINWNEPLPFKLEQIWGFKS